MLQLSSKEAAWDLTGLIPLVSAQAPAIEIEGDKKILH
jgi:hypothetical protein